MIDQPGREMARFPGDKEKDVRKAIQKALREAEQAYGSNLVGIAAGACGGDILFHECCLEQHIRSEVYLALPVADFREASVSFAGRTWEERFDRLIHQLKVHIMNRKKKSSDADLWREANMKMLDAALKNGKEHMTLLALWDGGEGDDTGGTEHLVNIAEERGIERTLIDLKKL
jgi:hypothetical protein